MYVVQRRDSEGSSWKTCSYNGRKCRYQYLPDARTALRKQKDMPEHKKIPTRTFRILDSAENKEVK